MSGGIRKFDLATELSSLGQGLKNWDYLWQPEKAYDGIHTPPTWEPSDAAERAAAGSYTSEDHNGFGFTLNFLTPKMVTMMKIYTAQSKISEWGVDYWDGSAWIRWGVFDTLDNSDVPSLESASRLINLATELSSLDNLGWWSWSPAKAYDGIHEFFPNGGDANRNATVFAMSYTSDDHIGRGFQFNFHNSIALTAVQIFEWYLADYEKVTQWCLEYWDGSAWIRWGVFDSAANRSGQIITLAIDNTTIFSQQWRVCVTAQSTLYANWAGEEVAVFGWSQSLDFSVITLSIPNTSIVSDKWRVYATGTSEVYSNWYGTELEVWGSDTALPNTHSFNWAAKGIRLCKVP